MGLTFNQPTSLEDANTLLQRIECVHDLLCYNVTLQLGEQFKKLMEKHEALLRRFRRLTEKEMNKAMRERYDGRNRKATKMEP